MIAHIFTIQAAQSVVEYVANCAWQIPLLAAAAWLMVRLTRPEMRTQYWLWVAVLALAIVLPMQGLGDANASSIDGAISTAAFPAQTISHHDPIFPAATSDTPRYRAVSNPAPRRFTLHLSPNVTRFLTTFYVIAILFAASRFFRAWLGAQRLVKGATRLHLAPEARLAFEEIAADMGLTPPRLRESAEIVGPMVIGALRPVLLLPETARDYDPAELRAALCHELAHIRRHDYLVNLICEAAMLPVSWHPAAHAIERRIQQTREMVCDELAATSMQSDGDYALCLVSVTRRILSRPVSHGRTQAVGFFDKNTLEERVMRLTNEGTTMTIRTRILRTAIGIATLAAVVAVSMACHVKPTLAAVAQNPAPAATPAAAPAAKPSAQVFATGPVEGDINPPPAPATPSTPVAIARGNHANVNAEKGEFIHRWKSHDGEPFVMVNHDAHEPDEDQQAAVEDEFGHILQQDDDTTLNLHIPDIKLNLDQPDIKLNLSEPDIKLNLDKIKIDGMRIQIDQKEIQKPVDRARLIMNDPATKKQLEELRRLSKLDAQRQIAELKLNPPHIDMKLQMDMANNAFIDANVAKSLGDSEAQMKEIQRQIESAELKAKLDAATRMLEDVKKQLHDLQAKQAK